MSILKSLVIGTGAISKEHLAFLSNSELVDLAGVCDLSPAASKSTALRYGVENFGVDYRAMLEKLRPDVVHVLTPPHTHKFIATDCLESGAHVICEKPVAASHEEYKQLAEIAQRCNKYLIEDHNYRFNRPIMAIENLINQGKLGHIQEVEVRATLNVVDGGPFADANIPHPIHKMPAGVVHDFITHLTYLLLRFLPEVDVVKAAWRNHSGNPLFRYDTLDAVVIGGHIHGRLRFSGNSGPDAFQVSVRGSEGYVETNLFQPYLYCVMPRRGGKQLSPLVNHFVNGRNLMGASVRNFRDKVMQRTPYEGLHCLLHKTYTQLSNGEQPPVTSEDMERTSSLIDALLAEENRI